PRLEKSSCPQPNCHASFSNNHSAGLNLTGDNETFLYQIANKPRSSKGVGENGKDLVPVPNLRTLNVLEMNSKKQARSMSSEWNLHLTIISSMH
ncbi:MAG: hypothetical protein KC592_10015, partial [Nitrospira sp.]|nr:hypothetical protein [Nitrospira sp.]